MADQRDSSTATHALQRSIAKLAIGVADEVEAKRLGNRILGLDEAEEQFQIKVSGQATDYPQWAQADLPFSLVFSPATGDRMSSLAKPQFTFGVELVRGISLNASVVAGVAQAPNPNAITLTPVIISAVVVGWNIDDRDMIVGCSLKLAAIAPGDSVDFTAFVHASFQGYAAPAAGSDTGD